MKPPRTDHERCLTEQCWLGIGCMLFWAVLIMGLVHSCSGEEVRLRWNENPSEEQVESYRLWGNERYASASDLVLLGSYVPDPPASVILTLQQSSDLADWSDVSDVPPIIRPMDAPKKSFRLKIEQ